MAPPPYIYSSTLTRRERSWRRRRRRLRLTEAALTIGVAAVSLLAVLAGHLLG
jgi:hypothetical protein